MNNQKPSSLRPRSFVRAAWAVPRGGYQITGGRRGLWRLNAAH